MPVSLLSFAAAGPPAGDETARFVLRNDPPRQARLPLAERYRRALERRDVVFSSDHGRCLIDTVVDRQARDAYRCFGVAADQKRLLALVAWDDRRSPVDVRAAIRSAVTRAMNREFGRQAWIGEDNPTDGLDRDGQGSGAKRVRNRTQFDYLVDRYLPAQTGQVWTVTRGFVNHAPQPA
ncbi:MAG: hypothetical protein AAGB00_08215 [Planctomycetota bacterium]